MSERSDSGHHLSFVDYLVNSVTYAEQNQDGIIRPAVVPEMLPESFSLSVDLNLEKRRITPPAQYFAGKESLYSTSNTESHYWEPYYEVSSDDQNPAHDGPQAGESNTIAQSKRTTEPIPGGNDDMVPYFGKIEQTMKTSLSSSSSNEKIKGHKETVEDEKKHENVDRSNNSSHTKVNNDNNGGDVNDIETKSNKQFDENLPQFLSSRDYIETKHPELTLNDIEEKNDNLHHSTAHDHNNNSTKDELRNHDVRPNKSDIAGLPNNPANMNNLNNRRDISSLQEDDVYAGPHIPTNDERLRNSSVPKEKGLKTIEKTEYDNYFYNSLSDPPTRSSKGTNTHSLPPPSYFSNQKESTTITVHIGRIEVHATATDSIKDDNNNNYYYHPQSQSIPPNNHLQRLSLSDYLKQRAEGKF